MHDIIGRMQIARQLSGLLTLNDVSTVLDAPEPFCPSPPCSAGCIYVDHLLLWLLAWTCFTVELSA